MPDDFAPAALSRPPHGAAVAPPRRNVLAQLESAAIGRRAGDGSLTVRRGEAAGCVLYGPYMHLPAGRYRLHFRCRSRRPRVAAQPILAVEILVLSRFLVEWRDFTAPELRDGGCAVDFTVTPEHSLEGENEGRFEFRFFHLGNAGFTIAAVELETLPPNAAALAMPRSWRLLGRLHKTWRGRRDGDGGLVLRRGPRGLVLFGCWPYLRLPQGSYRLLVEAAAGPLRHPELPVLRIAVFGDSRWRTRHPLRRLARQPETTGVPLIEHEIRAIDIASGPIALDFAVPSDLALEAGADAPFDIRLHHGGNAALRIRAVELRQLPEAAPGPASSAMPMPQLCPSGRRRVVIIGNCQSETLRQGFVRSEALSRRFSAKYHFVQLPKNLYEFAARDLERCDILLVQDIRLWDEFPLRDRVRPGADILRFPLVRFASLWPFDAWNGPGDHEAHAREAPNLTFPYLDGLLGRLRREIPDPEARFAAYRALDVPGVVNYRRLHELEMRRLAAIDRQYGFEIGRFILENFRSRRLFHTTVRPNGEVFTLLMQFIARLVGVNEPMALGDKIDAALRNPQVPVHPKVAGDLGVRWVDTKTRYLNHGREISWEEYVRRYIAHYG
ncbi:MAG: WcbI family polysaccharide biosynthesis putative acetyltransferase [Thiohalocapsa sp.]